MLPLQLLDSFLLQYNVGDFLLVAFVLGLVAMVPLKSRKLMTLHVIGMGATLLLLPGGMLAVDSGGAHFLANTLQYKMVGLGLLVIGPVLYTTSGR